MQSWLRTALCADGSLFLEHESVSPTAATTNKQQSENWSNQVVKGTPRRVGHTPNLPG